MLHIGFAAALSSTACADDAAHASECVAWAEAGECPINRAFMQENCRLACGLCDAGRGTSPADEQPGTCTDPAATGCSAAGKDTSTCVDEHASCTEWASSGECETNPTYMAHGCRASCYTCESSDCHDDDSQCARWAAAGQCAANEDYMVEKCAFSCRVCFLKRNKQCRRDASMEPAAVDGTIDATFERLLQLDGVTALHREPWILRFERFLEPELADKLVAAAGHDFQRSRATGDEVTSSSASYARTSTTSWCNVPSCLEDATFLQVRARISELMRVPWQNSEHLQLLRYEAGQYYTEHHDQIAPRHSTWGPRLYTFFMYLSDVEEGGETNFTKLNLSIAPAKGSAIVWPSVLSNDPYTTDERTYHEAVPVVRGLKFAANFWMHMYDFQNPLAVGCDNVNYVQPSALRGADM
mmetsp:Transcript_5827/g.17239  ORF Transcript_5827/g.17239 Transcript_5827/m.17239 type:complete len:413 (+) Transcript_5827:1698-2936(+)